MCCNQARAATEGAKGTGFFAWTLCAVGTGLLLRMNDVLCRVVLITMYM